MLPPLPRVWAALTGRPRPDANSSHEFAQFAGPVESELRLVICHPTRGASCRGHQLHDLSYVDVVGFFIPIHPKRCRDPAVRATEPTRLIQLLALKADVLQQRWLRGSSGRRSPTEV
jgi:hypothetical protein